MGTGPNMKEHVRFLEGSGVVLEAVSGDGDLATNFRISSLLFKCRTTVNLRASFFFASKPIIFRTKVHLRLRFFYFCKS